MGRKSIPLLKLSVSAFAASVFIIVGYYFQFRVVQEPWYYAKTLTQKDFLIHANYTIKTIPTTYYEKDKLGDVLSGWHDKGGAHLYRLEPGSKFTFDYDEISSEAPAKKKYDECRGGFESVICTPCFFRFDLSHQYVNVTDILNGRQNGNQYYAAFAKLEDFTAVTKLWSYLKLPGIDVNKVDMEHAFVSNFEKPMLTAYIHANPVSTSMAVQFAGHKTWMFFPPEVFRGSKYLNSFQGDGQAYPMQSPTEDYDIYMYTSQPGDVLFFDENWGHAVYTHTGPNLMINFRKIFLRNALSRPADWLLAVLMKLVHRNKPTKKGAKYIPYTSKVKEALEYVDNQFCAGGKEQAAPWDLQMVDLLRATVEKDSGKEATWWAK